MTFFLEINPEGDFIVEIKDQLDQLTEMCVNAIINININISSPLIYIIYHLPNSKIKQIC